MASDPRVQKLLEALLESAHSPEDVCRDSPELLPQVCERWRRLRQWDAHLNALFPAGLPSGCGVEPSIHDGADLPQIPGYEVEALLGRGGMGIVFRARHLRLNRIVALKMVLTGAYAGPLERERFQREAEAIAGLQHPSIVQIHDVGDSEGRPYFTMEFVEGGSLSQKLAGTPHPARQAAVLLATLAEAAQAAHQGKIVHRDLKPANVLLTANGTPKISDFGLARRFGGEDGLTRTGSVIGTPSYMAPEQARGEPLAVGPAVDIYALGAILYELLTGRPPFRAETAAETIQQVIAQDPVAPSRLNGKVPRDLETICLKCLRKEPQQRYTSAAALGEDLQHFLRGEAIAARPEHRYERLARRVRRRPALSGAVAVATVLAVTLIGGGLWLISERTAATRAAHADEAASERAADEDLRDMVRWMKKSSWSQATAALERAKARLGNRASADLCQRMEQGTRDLQLAARLETIRLNAFSRSGEYLDFAPADKNYEIVFREAGFGQLHDNPQAIVAKVQESHIGNALVAALDHWSTSTNDLHRQAWLLKVAAHSDPDRSEWRTLARDPDIRKDEVALAKLLDRAPVHEQSAALLLALAKYWRAKGKDPVPFMRRVQQAHPNDFWVNFWLGYILAEKNDHVEAIRYYQAALAARPETANANNNLGQSLNRLGRNEEALEQYYRALELEPSVAQIHYNLVFALLPLRRYDEAIHEIDVARRSYPKAAILHTIHGYCLEKKDRHDEALLQHRQAVTLEPKNNESQRGLRTFLMRQGQVDDARIAWQAALEAKPAEHNAWYGYAELCLFLGREDEYHRARKALLATFGGTIDPSIAERTSRACLLLPATGDELLQAVALAERAGAAKNAKYAAVYPSFLFAQGLADYRQGRFDQAIAAMNGEASRVGGPASRLVLAMALHRNGRTAEARKTLASAILDYDWRANQVRDQDGWICHALRWEAERLIVPDLSAFLAGKYQPRDNDERLALLGVCQFTNRTRTSTRLYSDVFASAPHLAEDLGGGHRYNAARFAALAGSGRGKDADELGEELEERSFWRRQAHQWLREDLTAWDKAMRREPAKYRELVQQTLTRWRNDTDLTGIREPAALEMLPADERIAYLALWHDLGVVLDRADKGK
ncbi:serine/threonine-protein kinase [Fimbriiglobus ruber]|uniref:non-specific serine/threonine protein kinase n=1 Tax=Fimbriiglobus ruber TaxID=1908690 RepID=A0A225DDC9_9BACT|nr:serine/threonine-protein kinase [Fimbriiglobus ruber]OWK39482.1 Serine/threonine protein kinase PrkC, regulator of stationary phase [Fimbriiglobus ruber]